MEDAGSNPASSTRKVVLPMRSTTVFLMGLTWDRFREIAEDHPASNANMTLNMAHNK